MALYGLKMAISRGVNCNILFLDQVPKSLQLYYCIHYSILRLASSPSLRFIHTQLHLFDLCSVYAVHRFCGQERDLSQLQTSCDSYPGKPECVFVNTGHIGNYLLHSNWLADIPRNITATLVRIHNAHDRVYP